MNIRPFLRKILTAVLARLGYVRPLSGHVQIDRHLLYEWQANPQLQPSYNISELPAASIDYLCADNLRLKELQARYSSFNNEVTIPAVWADGHVRPEDIVHFRGDNAYVWQLRGPNMNIMAYALTLYYLKSIDHLALLDCLGEDEAFGNFAFRIDNRLVSRDLLDSVAELYFLEKHLKISRTRGFTFLDIGAGYGRLAHRTVCAMPNVQKYLCTDAIAVSTFVSEHYLRFRKVEDRAVVVPLDQVENVLAGESVTLAVNIHSFSECTLTAISWWLTLLQKSRVRYLMIVPNGGDHGGEHLLTNDGRDFGGVIEEHGYKLIAKDPKFADPVVQRYAINPTCHYLFEMDLGAATQTTELKSTA